MSVETALYPSQLNTNWPTSADMVSEGDDHLRLLKTVLKTTFPNFGGAFNATEIEANYLVGVTGGIQGQIDARGKIAGQTWTGLHVFPSTTTIGALTPAIRARLETVTSDVQAQLDGKADKTGAAYTGTHDFGAAIVRVPTLPGGTSNDAPASTAFVAAAALSTSLPGQTGNAGKFLATDGFDASWQPVTIPSGSTINTPTLNNPTLSGDVAVPGSVRGAVVSMSTDAIDCSQGNYFKRAVTSNTTFSLSNVPAGRYGCVVEVGHTSGAIAWPASVKWPNDKAPTLNAGKTHLIFLLTSNAGTTWRANALANYAN